MYNPQTNVLRETILGSLIIQATLCICAAVLFPVYNRVRHGLHKDWEYHKNTAAINKAMGFTITSGTKEGDYHDAGLQVLAVSPNGPSAKTGLRVGDKVKRLDYNAVKRLIVEHSGRTLVLPIERGERHFDCTIQVPKFALPFPGASY